MRKHLLLPLFFIAALGLHAASAKSYQVTGAVTALTDTVITVTKGDEKFEIDRTAATKIDGKLAVGARVTVHYKMAAASIEVKAPSADTGSKAAKGMSKADQAAEKAAERAAKRAQP
ncbi:MAG: hypothetical protein JNK23_11865 [Opitutaceae bacterium]|nr:hypothetical protein [Opitutaceae bacterium]